MSEALNSPTTSAASLYPADGGAAAAAAAAAAPIEGAATTAAPAGEATVTGAAGNDSIDAGTGNDSISGSDTATSTETGAAGNDSISGEAGNDSITAESYQFTLPEGFTEDAGLQAEARSVLLDAGVKPEKAQGLIDLFGKAVKASQDRAIAAHNTEQQGWLNEINAMPEFQGPTRETSLQAIGRVFDEYGTPEAKAAFNRGGVGNNPALVKMVLKMANVLTEGAPVTAPRGPAPVGKGGRVQPATVGQSLYPDQEGS